MTTVQRVAMIFGIGFLLTAIAGFFTAGGMQMQPADPATAPKILGMFPTNLLHNIVHLLFGVWGLVASRSFDGAKVFAKFAGIIYLVLVPLGFIFPDGFGLIPLGGYDPWLHLVLAAPLLYFGFVDKTGPVGPVGA